MRSLRLPIANHAKAWVLVDEGNPSLETQCLGLVEAMDFPAHLHRVSLPWLWRNLPLWAGPNIMFRVQSSPKPLMSPWPSFVICAGKVGLKIGNYLRKRHHAYTVAFEPASASFHKIIVEGHTSSEKRNKIMTFGPLHRIQPGVILQARQAFYRKIDHLPKPRVGVFLEGSEPLEPLIETLISLYKKNPFSLMIHGKALSEESLKRLAIAFKKIPHLLWYGQEEDPYLGFLAHSDAIVVSPTSSLMVAEAGSVGKPLFIYPSFGLNAYVQTLMQKGYAPLLSKESHLFSGPVLSPLQETQRVAQIIKDAYAEALANSHTLR